MFFRHFDYRHPEGGEGDRTCRIHRHNRDLHGQGISGERGGPDDFRGRESGDARGERNDFRGRGRGDERGERNDFRGRGRGDERGERNDFRGHGMDEERCVCGRHERGMNLARHFAGFAGRGMDWGWRGGFDGFGRGGDDEFRGDGSHGRGGRDGRHGGLFGHRGDPLGRHEGERRERRPLGHGDLRLVVLALVARKPSHGYELIKAIEEASAGLYVPSPGVIYPTLSLLVDQGFIGAGSPDEQSRKNYQITTEGQEELARHQPDIDRIFARLEQIGKQRKGSQLPDIAENIHRLRNLLRGGMMRADLQPEQVERINAALLAAVETLQKELDAAAGEQKD